MPTLVASSSIATQYEISNSLRTANASAEVLQKTLSGNGNRRTFTYSGWLKKSYIQVNADPYPSQYVFFSQAGSNSNDGLRFVPDGNKLGFLGQSGGSTTFSLTASASFRDPSAWLHIVAAVDTTQGTAANRVKLYANGVQLTTFDQAIYPSENLDTNTNTNGVSHRFQGQIDTNTNYFRGYGSEIHFIDGAAKAPTDFGEFDDNGVWIPKAYTGSYGTHGVYFQFKQTGTSANASGMGADTSGNDNHYTPTNLTADSVTTDTPTNNFATLNSLQITNSDITLSEGNLKHTIVNNWKYTPANMAATNGKWYAEVKAEDASNFVAGFMALGGDSDKTSVMNTNNTILGTAADGWSMFSPSYSNTGYKNNDSNTTAISGTTIANNDIVILAMDLDNQKIYFGLNGTWNNSGNPANQTNPAFTNLTAGPFYTFASGGENNTNNWNFGNPAFAISSGNADANGYGNFEYAVPSGYYSLCTKNLAEFG